MCDLVHLALHRQLAIWPEPYTPLNLSYYMRKSRFRFMYLSLSPISILFYGLKQ